MAHILLLGAGFSRNWDGWLASEIMDKLRGSLHADQEIAEVLGRVDDFEEALSQVQSDFSSQQSPAAKARLDRVQNAILDVFGHMNRAFAEMVSMEFSNQMQFSIQSFLAKFDAIFTLNQDLLFELHYNIEVGYSQRWAGHHFPGMQSPRDFRDKPKAEKLAVTWEPMQQFRDANYGGTQPIFKLHGSVNWRDRNGNGLLVMGANKQGFIRENEILRWYSDEFTRHLAQPNTRLMVIGYGFRDHHINNVICEAGQKARLGMYIVDPNGRRVLNKQPAHASIRVRAPLEEVMSIGGSTRPISSIFSGDRVEHPELLRFFG